MDLRNIDFRRLKS